MRSNLGITTKCAQADSASARLFERATRVLPVGKTRTAVHMASYPPYATEGQGCWVVDAHGDRRLDRLNNYGHPELPARRIEQHARDLAATHGSGPVKHA